MENTDFAMSPVLPVPESNQDMTSQSDEAPNNHSSLNYKADKLEDESAPALLMSLSLETPADVPCTPKMEDGHGEIATLSSFEELHPLQNPVILTHLFERCPCDILAKCRLVCKQWYDLSLKLWLSSFPIEFSHSFEGGLHDLHLSRAYNGPTTYENFVEFVENPNNNYNSKPFANVELMSSRFGPSIEEIQQFWALNGNGSHLTILHLFLCRFTSTEQFRNVLYNRCINLQHLKLTDCNFPALPVEDRAIPSKYIGPIYGRQANLKSLTVSTMFRGEYVPHLPVTWLELFSHFPSLSHLEVHLSGDFGDPFPQFELDRILPAVRLARRYNGFGFLKTFRPRPNLVLSSAVASQKSFGLLQQLQLPLKQMAIMIHPELSYMTVDDALEFFGGALTFFSVYGDVSVPLSPWTFPSCQMKFANLDDMMIHDLLCTSMEFLRFTPNLRKLRVYERYNKEPDVICKSEIVSNTSKTAMVDVKLLKFRSLKFGSLISVEDLTWLIQWMPHVEKLRMLLDDPQFALVCQHWRDLTLLCVFGDRLSDLGVTGMGVAELMDGELCDPATIPPNITSLKALGRFRTFSPNLTDMSILHGFGKLKELYSIRTFTKPIQLGDAARMCLEERGMDLEHRGGDNE